jgi:hypothetical protein
MGLTFAMAISLLCKYLLQVTFRICLDFYLGVVLPEIADHLAYKDGLCLSQKCNLYRI